VVTAQNREEAKCWILLHGRDFVLTRSKPPQTPRGILSFQGSSPSASSSCVSQQNLVLQETEISIMEHAVSLRPSSPALPVVHDGDGSEDDGGDGLPVDDKDHGVHAPSERRLDPEGVMAANMHCVATMRRTVCSAPRPGGCRRPWLSNCWVREGERVAVELGIHGAFGRALGLCNV
jgi:hypothetical protein